MLLTTGIVALSRKVADERAKKREARQGRLTIEDSEVAKQAFDTGIDREATNIKYDNPNDIGVDHQGAPTPSTSNSKPALIESPGTPPAGVSGSSKLDKRPFDLPSPYNEYSELVEKSPDELSPRDSIVTQRPPYSPEQQSPVSSIPLSSVYSSVEDEPSSATSAARSNSTRSTNSRGTHAIRIKTVGADLKSGFPYDSHLFELRVNPEKWTAFTTEIIELTRLSIRDHAQIWSAATATALTGAIGTSILLGRSLNRSKQEKKVKSGLTNISDGGLGDILKRWNDKYFSERGIFVHLELSESAMKNPGQRSKSLRKSSLLYSKREDRQRKQEERKFVIVVTKLDQDGEPTEALRELNVAEQSPVEIGSSDEPSTQLSELPGDAETSPVELPAEVSNSTKNTMTLPAGCVEMDSDNAFLLQKFNLENEPQETPVRSYDDLIPRPLSVKREFEQ